jgi:hypothetical protein
MPRVLALYSVIYIICLSNKEPQKNKRCHNPFLGSSPQLTFFLSKNNNKKKTNNLAKTGRGGFQICRRIKL